VTHGGLGFESARAIAQCEPQLLILAGRSKDKNEEAKRLIEEEVKENGGKVEIKTLILDLGSFEKVREAVGVVEAWGLDGGIDVLINNAAIMFVCSYLFSSFIFSLANVSI
jgi:NAD(P)-dependent dehydrogenase (short-subunit alcohol dehydrogenase family)